MDSDWVKITSVIVVVVSLVFTFFKWYRKVPRITVSTTINQNRSVLDISVDVRNIGNDSTTLERIELHSIDNCWSLWEHRPQHKFEVITFATNESLPYEIKSGGYWACAITPDNFAPPIDPTLLTDGKLYVAIFHSLDKHPVLEKVL